MKLAKRIGTANLSRSLLCLGLLLLWQIAVQAAAPKRLLVVTVTKGFRHDTIPLAERILSGLSARGEYTVDFARTDSDLAQKMTVTGLKAYDGVVFASTTGDLPLPDRQAFLDWIKTGHAFIGIHSASDTFHGYRPYLAMLGGEFKQHGPQVPVTCQVADRTFPATVPLGSALTIPQEEVYQFQNFEPKQVHLLLYLDQHPNNHTPGLYPLAWCRAYGKGHVFYTALGHRTDIWEAPWYQQHLLGGIKWALGLAKGDDKPRPLPSVAQVAFPAAARSEGQ